MKDEIIPHVPGLRTLCPTRWTVWEAAFQSIIQNYPTLFATWEEAIDIAKQPDLKARIGGVASKIKDFRFICLLHAECILQHCDNLSKALQSTVMSAAAARHLTGLCVGVLQSICCDNHFDFFWKLVLLKQVQLEVNLPVVPHQRKRPSHQDGEETSSSNITFNDPATYYKQMYYECLDVAMTAIKDRFKQKDFMVYCKLEQLLIKALCKDDFTDELQTVVTPLWELISTCLC